MTQLTSRDSTALTFGEMLRRYRRQTGLSQEQLAERAEVSPRGLGYLEKGKHRPLLATARRLAGALGLEGDERAEFLAAADMDEAPASPPAPAGILAEPTPFIGREREVEALVAILRQSDVRLVTLTGPGGIGKTRLALRVGSELATDLEGRITFVPLAGVGSPELVPGAIVAALGMPDASGRPGMEALIEYLRDRKMLLILDNFEHLVEAGQVVADLIAACPHLGVLVTSRTVLRLAAEHVFDVPPLATPDRETVPSEEALAQYDAVALFVARARARKADFALTPENAPAVAAICRHLDGLPLAIELAAARVSLFSPPALLARLSNRLSLLIGGARDVPERQQTLRRTIDWSYQLLTAPEQTLFARLSVFQGGCTLDAIEAICMTGDVEIDVLEGMTSLVEKSLLRQVESRDAESRFAMLETIQEYAQERLSEEGESEKIRQRHAEYFAEIAEGIDAASRSQLLDGPSRALYLAQPGAEEDNLRAALTWAVERGQTALGLRLAPALTLGWHDRTWWTQLRASVESLLAQNVTVPLSIRARGVETSAHLAVDTAEVCRRFEEAIGIYRQIGDREAVLRVLMHASAGPNNGIDASWRERLAGQALALARELGAKGAIGISLRGLGFAAQHKGQFDQARTFFGESLAMEQARGHQLGMAWSRHALAWIALLEGQFAHARELAAMCEPSYRAADAFFDLGNLHALLAIAEFLQEDYGALYARFHQSALEPRLSPVDRYHSQWLHLLAAARAAEGATQDAARLQGAADASEFRAEDTALAEFRDVVAERFASSRARLDDIAWQTAWEEGHAMSLPEAVAYALSTVPTAEPPP